MEKLEKSEFSKNAIRIIKGSIIALILTLIMLIIFAMLLAYTPLQENTINPVTIVISAISVLIGSSLSTIKIKKNGLVNGAFVGLIYILIIYLLSSLISLNFSLNLYSAIMIFSSIITGLIGGIIGVNL